MQAMLDEAVKGKQGERTDINPNLLYNIQEVKTPTGTSRTAGLRKLRKYADERPEVAEAYAKVLSDDLHRR